MRKQILSILLVVCLVLNMLPDMAYGEATVKITYNANGGSGSMEEGTTTENMLFTLPDCTFTPPEGKLFQCWAIGSTEGTQLEEGGSYTFTYDTIVYAVWRDTVSITTTTLPDATVGTAYHQALTVTGSAINLSTIAWSVADGSLPTGLGLDTSKGEINGTPTTEGSTTFTIKASDVTNSVATRVLTVKVLGATGEEGITSWTDLKEAISKANASEHTIITIGADFNTSSAAAWDPINISKSKHITLQSAASGNFTITRADGNQGRFFTISENGSLTLRNITLDGGGENLSKAPYSPMIGASHISGTTQDLILESGAVLQNNHTRGECGGAIKFESGNITMNSGSMIQNNSSDIGGGGIYLLNSTLTMNEGMIRNNTVTGSGGKSGGGVQVSSNMGSGVFNMRGGSITDNTAYMGGGVSISGGDSAVFNLSGGEITGNTATGYIGGGVYLGSGSFRGETELNGALMNILGNPVISGNKGVIDPSRIVASDLYIQGINPGITTKPAILQKNGQLTSGASVGVILMKTNNATILVSDGTHAVTEADAAYFFSNRATSTIEYDSELEALVAVENSSAPIITTDTLPDGILGTAYSQTLAATGTTPITWSVTEGDLPSGLSLDSSTGIISGTPTAAKTATFTIQASNGTTPVATKELSITITNAAVTIWDGTIAQYFDGGLGTEEDPYQIRTAEQLALLANVINGVANKKVVEGQADQIYADLRKAYYKLTADIKLNDTTKVTEWNKNAPTNNWIPIGRIHAPFRGVFDGGNYTVSGLYSNKSTVDYYGFVGLFGYTDDIIKNVTVKDGYIDGYDDVNSYVAGIAGRNDGTIDNCHNIVTLVAKHYAGGIVAYNSGKIKDCSNAGNITTTGASDHSCGAGGIVSVNSDPSSLIDNCTNSGKIVGAERVGGICGHQLGVIKNCINTGNISGNAYVGGIIGILMDGEVWNCINIGMVSGNGAVGGILGRRLTSTIENVFSPKGVTQGATSNIGTSSHSYGYLIGSEQVSGSYTGDSDSYGGITVSPASATVAQGNTNTFSANGMKSGDTVEWMVGGGISATTINANGMLTVAGNETAKSLTVIAIVKTNSVVTGVGIAAITIETLPTVTGVTITPNVVSVARGSTQLFSAEVTGVNNPVQTVDWSIVETVQAGTSIDAKGLLTVASGETATSLTIKATSTADNTKSGTATVTITTDSGKVWDGTSAQYFDGGIGTVNDPYQIRTAEQLALLADVINGDTSKKVTKEQVVQTYAYLQTATYVLTADINLNNISNVANWGTTAPSNSWKIIGKSNTFNGVFDGKNYIVSGLYYNGSTYAGLFGNSIGTIKNLNVSDGYIKGTRYVGGVVGIISSADAKIYNCNNSCTVNGTSAVGGVVGGSGGEVNNCSNSGRIDGGREVGGVVGVAWEGKIQNCINTGYISAYGTSDSGYCCGGVLGANNGVTISNIFSPKGYVKNTTVNYGNEINSHVGYLVGWGNATNSGSDSYGSITISPASATLAKGGTKTFMINGKQSNDTVEWSVSSGISGTMINDNGMLTVADNETAKSLTVIAIVKTNSVVTGVGIATITIETLPTVTGVTITPNVVSVARGSTQQFGAEVTGENGPDQTVTWSIMETVQAGTSIDAKGLLTVAAGETATSLTIKATSTADNTKSATATVTVTADNGKVWDGTSALYFDGGLGTKEDPYQIRTAEQLTLLAGVINQYTYDTNNTSTIYGKGTRKVVSNQDAQTFTYLQSAVYILTEDIRLNDTSEVANWAASAPSNTWKIIGDFNNFFKGTFDGAGHSISGLFYSNSQGAYGGLFSVNYGIIKNLYLKEGYINVYCDAGSIVGGYNHGTIVNCHNYISVTADYRPGGLASGNLGGTIKDSSNAGNVTQREKEGPSGTNYAGGITSFHGKGGIIENCTNTGTVTGAIMAGGIVGVILNSSVSNCTNTGTVTGTIMVGGISGNNDSGHAMKNCINTGIISGTNLVGGITGDQYGGSATNVFSPKGVTVGATSDIGKAESYYGYIIGRGYVDTSCSSDHYGNITISPASTTLAKGGTKTFTVNGKQGNDTVEWSVTGGINGTTITANGLLTVANGETAASLTVTAIVKTNGSVTGAGTAKVTIGTPPTVTEVTINPDRAEVVKGKTQQFTATVKGNNSPPQEVEWNVTGGGSGTTISESGLLLVGVLETATTLTVKATSTSDSSVYATATVTVISGSKLYTVTFDSQGGSAVSSVGGIEEGKTITLPEVPTRNGYRFGGWFTQVNGGGMSFATLTPVTVNITVYAKWTKVINLSGTVYGTDASTPISGAVVTLSPVTGTTAKTTGGDGRFGFTDIPEGIYAVTAVYPDGSSASVNVSGDYDNVKIIKPVPHIEITNQPADATIVLGIADSSAVFKVLGQRTPDLAGLVSYQWYWLKGTTPNGGSGAAPDEQITNSEGTPVSGSQITLNRSNTNSLTRGTYRLYAIAYNANGEADKVYSRMVTLKVIGTNTIEGIVKKEDGTLIEGASVTLVAIATPAYIPYTSSTNPQTTGADGAYLFNTVPDGTYKLVITLPGGGVIESENVVLPKIDPNNPGVIEVVVPNKAGININGQPQDVMVKNGKKATLSVNAVATDGTALTYQWYKNSKNANTGGTELSGATEKDYTPITTEKGTFYYYCVVTGGSLEAAISRNAKVTVVAYGVISGTVKTKENAFIVNAVVELVNTDIPVQTGFTTSANPQTTLADGKYRFTEVPDGNYKLKITLPDGTKFENPIVVPGTNEEVIITPPEQPTLTITGQPRSMTVVLSDTAEFSVMASVSSGETVLYQWYRNTEKSTIGGTAISGATKETYRAATTTKSISYYYCVVNAAGAKAVTSNLARLTVRNTPIDNLMTIEGDVLDDTTPRTPVQGATVALSPKAGTSKNPQTTGADGHYKFVNLPDGKYTITVTLPNGGTVTEKIVLDDGDITPTQPSDIEVPATNSIRITKQPADILLTTDMTAVFDTKATASKTGVTYQWYSSATNTNSGGIKLEGKTDTFLQLDKQAEGISYYYCVISSKDATDLVTRVAKLTVTKAAGNKGDVGGSIVDDVSGKTVEGASVKLMKNGTDGDQFGSTVITGEDGKFQFTDIPYGSYSLVAQKGTQIITRQISIRNKLTTENLTLLSGGKLTRVEVAQGAPSAAVENLEEMFTSDDAVIAQQPGATIEIKLVVERKDSPEDKEQIKALLKDDQQVGLYLEAKLIKTISGTVADDSTEYIQPSAGQVLRIVIDLPEGLQGKSGYKIIRSHTENGVTSIRIIDNPVYDETLQTLTFEADAFSTYAVAYTQALNYSVTVLGSQDQATSGTGLYHENDTVRINAGTRSGYTFAGWTSTDGVSFAAVSSATTTFTMPAKNVTISANWQVNEGGNGGGSGNGSGNENGSGNGNGNENENENENENGTDSENKKSYSVTVKGSQSGKSSGAGLYKEGDTVAISAGARSGYTFTGWTSTDGVRFADADSETTTFTMVAKAVTVTAKWKASKGESGKTGNGSDTDSGNGKDTDSGNGKGTDSGNGKGTDTGNGKGTDTGNESGTDSENGSDKDSGNGSSNGRKSDNSTGGNSSASSDSNSNTGGSSSSVSPSDSSTGDSDSAISENGSNTGESDSNADGDQITTADLSKAKDDALKNLADQREKAINSLPDTMTSEKFQMASDEIDRIYNAKLKMIQNAETQEAVSTIYDKAISDINTVLADQGVNAVGENTDGENTGENKGAGKPFILFNALLTLAAILAAGLLLLRRGKEWMTILAAASAAAALAVFLFTSGFSGFALLNLWTIASAVFAACPIGLLWHAVRNDTDGMQ